MKRTEKSIPWRIVFSVAIFLCILCSYYVNTHSNEQIGSTFLAISPVEVVKDMSPGWNLGNTLDAIPTEGSWNNPPVAEYTFDDIKNSGFKSIRLPVTWTEHIGSAPDYKVDPKWMDRVEQVVDWALKRDLYVMLNVHHDSWMWMSKMAIDPETGRYVNDYDNFMVKFEKLWEQIAERFKGKNKKLILEILNEPHDGGGNWPGKFDKPKDPNNPETRYDLTPEQMNDVNRRILKIIRSSGGYNDKRLVMVTGLGNDCEKTLKFFKTQDDKYIILTVHYYAPWDFVSNWWGKNTWGDKKDKRYPIDIFKKLNKKFVENGLPIVVGEWGALEKNDLLSRWYYHDYIVKTTYKYGMTCILWDNGAHYFDRKNRAWIDETIKDIIVNAGLGIPNSFIFPVDNYLKTKTQIKDLIVKMELNGNRLVDIYNGRDKLIKNYDYVLNSKNSNVKIRRNYISKLIEPGKLGTNVTLKFDFSRGVDMPLNIIQYDLPKFSENLITVDKTKGEIQYDMKIPVSFNGTKLATIKLVDEIKKKPIIDSWHPYLRLHEHFDYNDTSSIILKKKLLNSLKADSLITFEFWPKNVKVEMEIKVLEE